MKREFTTLVFTALTSGHVAGFAAETPPAAEPVTADTRAANTESHGEADQEDVTAAKKSMRITSEKPMKMDEPMDTPMAKEGMIKEDVKKSMMEKDSEMKKVIEGEEEEMR